MKRLPPYFGLDADVQALSSASAQAATVIDSLWLNAARAWLIRERDAELARSLATQVLAQIEANDGSPEQVMTRGLALNTLAAVAALRGELDAARNLANQAAGAFKALDMHAGEGDACMVRAAVAWDRSDTKARGKELQRAHDLYEQAADPHRQRIALAHRAHNDRFDDPVGTEARWREWLQDEGASTDQGITAVALEARASFAFWRADYAASVSDFDHAYAAAIASGQTRVAVTSLIGVGISLANLGDSNASLGWLERALDMAREQAWPVLLGQALQQYGMSFFELQRWEPARAILKESIDVLQPFKPSRRLALSLAYWGELAYETGDFEESLRSFLEVQSQADQIADADMKNRGTNGMARALAHIGRLDEATVHARLGLDMSRALADPACELVALRTLADVLRRRAPDEPTTPGELGSSIECLEQALVVAQSIDGFMVDAGIFSELAADYANANDYKKAFEIEQRATQARKQTYSKEATDRVTALQVRYDTERTRARAEHSEAIANTLQSALETLELLGEIGKEITAKLDPQSVFDALNRHIGRLMDASHLSIFQMEHSPPCLRLCFGVSGGKPLSLATINIDDPLSKIARCAREQKEIYQDRPSLPGRATVFPGTEPTASMAYLPLIANGKLFGVLSVQSSRIHAYGQRELLVLRTLCAYSAIALANATVVAELHRTQGKLVAAMDTLQRLATHDALTGAVNRGGFYESAEKEIGTARRTGQSVSVILFDLDHFKNINDTWGHSAGDEVLKTLVRVVDAHSQVDSRLARLGGEEFALLLPRVAGPAAAKIAENLCTLVASTTLETRHALIAMTASFAVAELEDRDATIDDMLARADAALYDAKHAGRNRVRLASAATAGPV
jgi:diguanylate cyclase (GGDEF)-like protein